MLRRAVHLLCLLPCLASGCTYFTGDPHVVITSTPAGAEVLINGEPTGKTTPVRLDLGGIFGTDHRITLRKEGFVEEQRAVIHYSQLYGTAWVTGVSEVETPAWPLDWTVGDFFLPFGLKWRYVPHELHVVLYGEGLGPVQGDSAPENP